MATSDIFAQMTSVLEPPFAIDGNSGKILGVGTEIVSNQVMLHTSAAQLQLKPRKCALKTNSIRTRPETRQRQTSDSR